MERSKIAACRNDAVVKINRLLFLCGWRWIDDCHDKWRLGKTSGSGCGWLHRKSQIPKCANNQIYIYMLSAPSRAYLFLSTRISSINLSAKTSKHIITIYLQSTCTCLDKHIKSPANKTCLGSLPYSSITLHQINPPKCTKQKKRNKLKTPKKQNQKPKKPKKPSLTGRCLGTQHSIWDIGFFGFFGCFGHFLEKTLSSTGPWYSTKKPKKPKKPSLTGRCLGTQHSIWDIGFFGFFGFFGFSGPCNPNSLIFLLFQFISTFWATSN